MRWCGLRDIKRTDERKANEPFNRRAGAVSSSAADGGKSEGETGVAVEIARRSKAQAISGTASWNCPRRLKLRYVVCKN